VERTHDFALGQARVAPQLEIRLEARQHAEFSPSGEYKTMAAIERNLAELQKA
jgi:hypothetical protein